MITVKEVNDSTRGMKDFIGLPYALYRDDRNWCPPLRLERKKFFSPHNPFVLRNRSVFFVAYDGNRPVGRVTAHIDEAHNRRYRTRHGFFGFYESIDSQEAARGLMHSAEEWARARQMESLSGPYNFNNKQGLGFLASGFEEPPILMMSYTRRYYLDLFGRLGYREEKSGLSYRIADTTREPGVLDRIAQRLLKKHGDSVQIMTVNGRDLQSEHGFILDIYNDAWRRTWGFIPMTEEELAYLIEELKTFADMRLIYKLYKDGDPAAFMLTLPNINEVLVKIRNGRLLPTGLFRFLLCRRLIRTWVIVIMGVKHRYHKLGLDSLLYHRLFQDRGRNPRLNALETTWILEDNLDMNRSLKAMGAVPTKRYVVLRKDL